jgi:hypothetical protein
VHSITGPGERTSLCYWFWWSEVAEGRRGPGTPGGSLVDGPECAPAPSAGASGYGSFARRLEGQEGHQTDTRKPCGTRAGTRTQGSRGHTHRARRCQRAGPGPLRSKAIRDTHAPWVRRSRAGRTPRAQSHTQVSQAHCACGRCGVLVCARTSRVLCWEEAAGQGTEGRA